MKITKKLRDVTPEEFKEWNKENCSSELCPQCTFNYVICFTGGNRTWINNKDLYSDKFLNQTIEIEVGEILGKEEKEYLSAVIKPFRDRVTEIFKYNHPYIRKHNISIYYLDEGGSKMVVRLPDFPYETMYKGMVAERPYKLEELGL